MLDHIWQQADIEPREYQQRIVNKALAMFAGGYVSPSGVKQRAVDSVMLESPTGSGKTVMGLSIAACLAREHGYSVGWVAMRRNLLAQAARENQQRRFDVPLTTISMFDKNPPKVELIVVDEAQHDAAMSMARLHDAVRPQKVLGLTATPYRSDRIKLCFEQVITDVGIGQLIEDGYLSRYHHYTIDQYSPEEVAATYAREPQRWGKSLIFFHRLEQCRQCAEALARHGFAAEVVTGQSNRGRQLADFFSGKIDILLSMAILAEGFDCPQLKTVFCRPSGKGCTVQMAGRVFRRHPNLPFKQIVQCKSTRYPVQRVAVPDEQYVWMADSWRTLQRNSQLDAITANALRLVAGCQAELPDIVKQNRETPRWHHRDRLTF